MYSITTHLNPEASPLCNLYKNLIIKGVTLLTSHRKENYMISTKFLNRKVYRNIWERASKVVTSHNFVKFAFYRVLSKLQMQLCAICELWDKTWQSSVVSQTEMFIQCESVTVLQWHGLRKPPESLINKPPMEGWGRRAEISCSHPLLIYSPLNSLQNLNCDQLRCSQRKDGRRLLV